MALLENPCNYCMYMYIILQYEQVETGRVIGEIYKDKGKI